MNRQTEARSSHALRRAPRPLRLLPPRWRRAPRGARARAKELGLAALALTDHDELGGAVRFASAARELELAGIIGAELTVTVPSRDGERAARHAPAPARRVARGLREPLHARHARPRRCVARAASRRVSLDQLAQHARRTVRPHRLSARLGAHARRARRRGRRVRRRRHAARHLRPSRGRSSAGTMACSRSARRRAGSSTSPARSTCRGW